MDNPHLQRIQRQVILDLKAALRRRRQLIADLKQRHAKEIRELRQIKDGHIQDYAEIAKRYFNMYEDEVKHNKGMFKQVVDYQARLTFYRSVTFALIAAVGSALVFNYFNP